MFDKLDADGSKALDMQEMSDLLHENSVTMSKQQVTEMFGAAKSLFTKNKNAAESKIDENLELLVDDFKLILTNPQALNVLRNFLTDFRRTNEHFKVPTMID